ncbi:MULTISPECIES: FAD-dependent oxidoreductase [Pandoraea]|uniref:Monooxygenase n=1 Tax=Pandoraea nosoerga TaxID=2508296 RepID=A0A5E4RCN9_9BURK|nr:MULTISPECIES: FAD-dependent oxidoreductase [Pandoraea]MBN4666712.1 FAD-dependent oxidoreductase [Pandoraea nosoerga]VVD60541.1 monooxygenase [Pandoraea nosoerga]
MDMTTQRMLVIGGGFSGMATAIEGARRGMKVDLVEIDRDWRSYGAGISISGPTLRALRTLGVLDAFLERGALADGLKLFAPHGAPIAQIPTPRLAGDEVPGGGAIMRPVLADILARATLAAGVKVKLGITFASLCASGEQVDVTFTDGTAGSYELVVGADGLYSNVRKTIFADAEPPRYTGQGVWRAVVPRPEDVTGTEMWLGARVKAGINPVCAERMYLFVTEDAPTRKFVDPKQAPDMLKALLAEFAAPRLQAVSQALDEHASVIYRPLERLLLRRPWHRGRIVLVGDAVHATTPHMASGAGIGIEDAIVLAEELARAATMIDGLEAFEARRWERCRVVVENSARLGEIEITRGDRAEHERIMRETHQYLAQAI